ncbi:MAG: regulatory protein RecX [Suilimivivens sp.]
MTVTKITEISKSKLKITIDEEFAFVLYKGELHHYRLQEGEEISDEVYSEIMEEILPKRAKLRAMNLLKTRAYTEKQLTDKLREGGYPESIIEDAISYVISYGYLNDRFYAADYIEYNKEVRSRTQIFNALIQKGIPKEIVEEVWEENVQEEGIDLEQKQILSWMKKKNFDPEKASYEEKQKFSAFLYRKGFQIDAIRCALLLDITSI